MRSTPQLITIVLIISLGACGRMEVTDDQTQEIDHEIWDNLLGKHVTSAGLVDYVGFENDRDSLDLYLELLSDNGPGVSWTREEKLAYWINAYNAFTVALILDHYPLNSIKDIGSGIMIPFVHSPWDIKFIEIAGQKLDLNNIEHNILRNVFNEPRIHFAINCASMSCPRLRNEAYTAERVELQLEEQAVNFINDPGRNLIREDEIKISRIFSWFSGDFTMESDLVSFLNQYSRTRINADARIEYLDYDWSLNTVRR